ncbi:hypothetical protein llap_12908 [Limosa lapponica baueri]|uniref:Cell growth-regulating nucleolar protein-like winged helix domain-containing protein n=1 Tax=Limosa lapponica baueri TaxID=1758121 RepID=A0A2I0TSN4_LIMLA|nr:hypothetical protein llap_12908 [Limosa lapponica baueri]
MVEKILKPKLTKEMLSNRSGFRSIAYPEEPHITTKRMKTENVSEDMETENTDGNEENVGTDKGKFNWKGTIKAVLKQAPDNEISIKKLRKKTESNSSVSCTNTMHWSQFKLKESTAVEKKRKPLARLNIHFAFWILASIAVTYYFDFFKTVKETIQADSWWFASGSCLLAACLAVAFYCILYLEWYCGIKDYDAQYPALIPITTATFIAAAICEKKRLVRMDDFGE